MTIELTQLLPIPLKDRLQDRKSAIWNSHLILKQGEYIRIKAPSGSGKTTLVHILYKLRSDYEGTIRFDDQLINQLSEDELSAIRQQKISIIFQDLRLFSNLTGRENIELKRILQTPFYQKTIIDEMAEELGVKHILDQKSGICSYGEQQRIAIIRALMQPFSWLIMDEPFSHLDKVNTYKAARLIESECRKRKAGLMITDLDEDSNFMYTQEYSL